jgi:shikimate dehydrogenase
MGKYGLIGYPLGHSLSPGIHKNLFEAAGLPDNEYEVYEINPDDFTKQSDFLSSLDGFNITIPYKKRVIQYCKKLDNDAAFYGAVNCVHKGTGYNTDVYGVNKSVELLGASLKSKVCLLGFGGAGRMLGFETLRKGGELTIAVRTPSKLDAEEHLREPQYSKRVNIVQISELTGDFDLIINATSVGMYPNVKFTPVSFDRLFAPRVLDIVYNPSETRFLKEAKSKGCKTLNGLPMLVWQAVRSHEIWNGSTYIESEIQNLIENTKP